MQQRRVRRGRPDSTRPARGGFHHSRRHAFVGQAHALGLAGVDVAAGEHHVQRRGAGAMRSRQPLHAAPAGEDAEHDFGQRELGRRLVDDDEVAAGQRQFERRRPCSGRESAPASDRARPPGGCRDPSRAAIRARADCGAVEAGEFLDVGAGDEAGRLAGAEDQALGRFAVAVRRAAAPAPPSHRPTACWCWRRPCRGSPRRCRRRRGRVSSVSVHESLHQHGAAQAAADADGGDALLARRCSRCSRCSTMRAPEAPTGWPRAMAPPSALSLPGRACPARRAGRAARGSRSSSCQAARQPSTWAAKASLISQASRSLRPRPWRLQDRRRGMHRTEAHLRRIEAGPFAVDDPAERLQVPARHRFFGSQQQQAAPSVICELLPAVMLP